MVYRPVLACLMLSLVFAGLFVADLFGLFASVAEPVAYVAQADGVVRRLPQDSLSWDRATFGTMLALGDTFVTGEGDARIDFFESANLELGPGSMIIIGGQLDNLKLSFLDGQGLLRVARAELERIQLAKVAPAAVAKQIEVERAPAPRPSLASHAPPRKVTPLIASIDSSKLRSPMSVLPKDSMLPAPRIRQPANDEIVGGDPRSPPMLAWDMPSLAPASLPPNGYEVQLRSDPPGHSLTMGTDRTAMSLTKVPAGRYLWSVRALASRGQRGPSSVPRWIEVRAEMEAPLAAPAPAKQTRSAMPGKPKTHPVKVE